MNIKKFFIILSIFILILVGCEIIISEPNNQRAIQFFPIDKNVVITDVGSRLEIFKHGEELNLVADTWSKTNKKVYLRQDVNLFFQNGYLIKMGYPWKEEADWIINKLEIPLIEEDSTYSILSYHHAEIHYDDMITCSQAVSGDKIYVVRFENILEAFKKPQNARQEETMAKIEDRYKNERLVLLEKGMKELNINQENYEIHNLDFFSLNPEQSKVITKDKWQIVLGGLWEGLYRNYVLSFSSDELEYFSPPMPWILIDRNGTHILILYQRSNGNFEKLLMEI